MKKFKKIHSKIVSKFHRPCPSDLGPHVLTHTSLPENGSLAPSVSPNQLTRVPPSGEKQPVEENVSNVPASTHTADIFLQSPPKDSELKRRVCNVLKMTLTLFNETLNFVPVPGLKAVFGGALQIMEIFDVAHQNQEDLTKLGTFVDNLNGILLPLRDWPSMKLPPRLVEQIEKGSKDLDGVNQRIITLLDRSKFLKIIDGPDDTQEVMDLFGRIQHSIDAIVAGSILRTEVTNWTMFLRSVLKDLRRAEEARWDYVPNRRECLDGTRTPVLNKIKEWVDGEGVRRVYWLNGQAGTGKTTIAQSIAGFYAHPEKNLLGASFFCSYNDEKRKDLRLIFPTLAFQLAKFDPKLVPEITKAIVEDIDIDHAQPEEQLQKLIIEPLRKARSDPIMVLIDALDECEDVEAPQTVLNALSQCLDQVPFLKVFVASRPVSSARGVFRKELLQPHSKILVLHEVDLQNVDAKGSHIVDKDIWHFLDVELRKIAQDRELPDWPPDNLPDSLDLLVKKSGRLFIYASTLCRFLAMRGDFRQQLDDISDPDSSVEEGLLGIDVLYRKVFDSALMVISSKNRTHFCSIIGTIVLLQNVLSMDDLSAVLGLQPDLVRDLLEDLHSVLVIPSRENTNEVIRTIHASLPDFLMDKNRCTNENLLVRPVSQHRKITIGLLRYMIQRQDLADWKEQSNGALDYARSRWEEHLSAAAIGTDQDSVELVRTLDKFLGRRFQFWFKALTFWGTVYASTGNHISREIQQYLFRASYVARDAAAVALMANDHQRALMWLERGRSLVLSQRLKLWTPFNFLAIDPSLGSKLQSITQLETWQDVDVDARHGSTDIDVSLQVLSQAPDRMFNGWETLLNVAIKDFENIFKPPQLLDGVVVMINASKFGCDALIIKPSQSLLRVPLDDFSYEQAEQLQELVHAKEPKPPIGRPKVRALRLMLYRNHSDVRGALAHLWVIVKPILDELHLEMCSKPRGLSRVWWCLTGPLSYLPIHAAGLYSDIGNTPMETLMDYAISSYTPTLTALLSASQRPYPEHRDFKLLAVARPSGIHRWHKMLPGTLAEVKLIEEHASCHHLAIHTLKEAKVTVGAVTKALEECSWIHFACHRDLHGRLALEDGGLNLTHQVIEKIPPHAEFACISACGTSYETGNNHEEYVSVAAEMLLSGYRGAVAPMWLMRDEDGPVVADNMYAELFHDGVPDSAKAAQALHNAVQKMRKEKDSFESLTFWVPWIHVGI